jgi:uncharacterized protein YndB with AHSA1/START domain
MKNNPVLHETIEMERTYQAGIDRVFAAFADPAVRAKWGVPSDTAVFIYDEVNFTTGGRDLFRCGSKSDPKYHGETHYLHIVPDECIVSTETVDADGKRLSASLTTVQFTGDASTTKIALTVQVAAFGGSDMIEGTKFGHNAALNNLGRWLSAKGA